MKKRFLLLVCVLLIGFACEKDDICVEDITPKLIVRFYDANDPTTTKDVNSLNVWVTGKDTIISNQTLDSIAIPLDVNALQTVYNFRSESLVDILTINYTVNEVYVSRSCGFIANYDGLNVGNTGNWIQSVQVISTTIDNENEAHVEIRH